MSEPNDTPRGGMNRRAALKVLGALPLAAALPHELTAETPLAPGAPTAEQAPAAPAAHKFFTAHEMATVRVLSDLVIPRDERSGSATDARGPEFMDVLLADRDASDASKIAMRGGLAWIDNESRSRFGRIFVNATDAQRRQILDDIAWPARAKREHSHGVAFFNRFRDLTASGFFSSAMGWKDVQYIGNTFNPKWQGCPQPALDKLGVAYDLMSTRVKPDQ